MIIQVRILRLYIILWMIQTRICRYQLFEHSESFSVEKFAVNITGLSITASIYNPSHKTSPYIERIFGNRAIFVRGPKNLPKRTDLEKYLNMLSDADSIMKYFIKGHTAVMKRYHRLDVNISYDFLIGHCSIELLGFTMLGFDRIFKSKFRDIAPSIGLASIHVVNNSIDCYYRGLYENNRPEYPFIEPYHWPTIFYCPIRNIHICNTINHRRRDQPIFIPVQMTMYLSQSILSSSVKIRVQKRPNIPLWPSSNVNDEPRIAVCTIIPYTSSNESKRILNIAILYEWIRYYQRLGIRIMIYDRDGINYDHIMHSKYSTRPNQQSIDSIYHNIIHYYNFTIRGILDPNRKEMKYDNTENYVNDKDSESRRILTGNDKTLTFTHCRYDASSLYGIDDVIAIDFDEFIYCHQASHITIESQRKYIHSLIQYMKISGYDQLSFSQRILLNKTGSVIDCLNKKIHELNSIFDCFGPFSIRVGGRLLKSIHIGHKCPLTGFHSSCPWELREGLSHDCLCSSININDQCQLIHIVTRQSDYNYCRSCPKHMDDKFINNLQKNELLLLTTNS